MVGADIEPANVVAHDDDNVRLLPSGGWCRCRLLRLRGSCQSDSRERRGGDQRATTQQEVAAFQSCAGRFAAGLGLLWNLILAHGVILFLVIHLKPTWLAEGAIGAA